VKSIKKEWVEEQLKKYHTLKQIHQQDCEYIVTLKSKLQAAKERIIFLESVVDNKDSEE